MCRILFFAMAMLVSTAAAQQPQRECPVADLALGDAVTATLDAADCKFSDINGGTLGSLVKRYRVRVDAAAKVLILGMTATGFTPQLLVYAAPNRLVANNVGAAAAGARVAIHLPAGDYTVFAMASRADVSGTLSLKAEFEELRTCPRQPQALPLDGGAAEGSFDASTCRFLDSTPFSTNEAHVVFYSATMPRVGVLDLQAQTAVAGFSMVLSDATLAGFRGTQALLVSLNPGAVLISVSSTNRGSYSLKSAITTRRECNQTPMVAGTEVTADLALAGCRVLDYRVPSSDARPMALYRFSVTGSTIIEIDEKAPVLDSLLYLFDSRAVLITQNDDAFEENSDARIQIHLPAGSYVIGASTFDRGVAGSISLKLAASRPRFCDAPALSAGETVTGQIPETGCRLLDYLAFSEDELLVAPFTVDTDQKRLMTFGIKGLTAGFYQLVNSQAVNLTGGLADRNGDVSAEMILLPGKHTVLLGSDAEEGRPEFTVKTSTRELPVCETGTLPANGDVTEALTAVECKASELIPYLPLPVSAKAFKLEVTSRGRVAITAESAAFVPLLAILQGTDNRLLVTGRQTPGAIPVAGTLVAGEYRVVVGTLSTLGEYKLKSEFTPEGTVSTAALRDADASGVGPVEFSVGAPDVVGIHEGRVDRESGEVTMGGEVRNRARKFAGRGDKQRR